MAATSRNRSISPPTGFFYPAGNFRRHSATAVASPATTICSTSSNFLKLVGSPIDYNRSPISSTATPRKTCMCSPTTHPGSFRCSLHKGLASPRHAAVSSPSIQLYARRSAMSNSLVRIGSVEGDWVKRALAALIRPSSHQQRRRGSFKLRPSRLSVMSKAEESAV